MSKQMSNFHPSDNELLEFSAGKLDWALAVCVSAHLQMCPHCKHKTAQFNAIGGSLLSKAPAVEVEASCFASLMTRIKSEVAPVESADTSTSGEHSAKAQVANLPPVVQKLLPKNKALRWSFASPSLRIARLETGQDKYEVCFHKIMRGGKVVEHDHRGREVTLVLEGSFSDEHGQYLPGDYIVKEPGEIHRPMAALDQDCLCLSVAEAPVKVTGLLGSVINPFLSISPR